MNRQNGRRRTNEVCEHGLNKYKYETVFENMYVKNEKAGSEIMRK